MKENPEFIGRTYNNEEKAEVSSVMNEWSDESLKPIEGEIEKTPEEIKLFKTVNTLIGSELESLGVTDYEPIPLEKIHMLPDAVFKDKSAHDPKGKAFFKSVGDVVFINKDRADTKARLLANSLHELIHRASTKKFYVTEDKGIQDARVGYRIRSSWKEDNESRLTGFNEVMTDSTLRKILLKNQEMLARELGITRKDIDGSIYSYMHYFPVLNAIVKKVAEDKKLPPIQVFDDFERGQFENTLLVLKDIEHSFGKGSLRVLALFGTLKKTEDEGRLNEMITNYFSENDEAKRLEIQNQIDQFVEDGKDSN